MGLSLHPGENDQDFARALTHGAVVQIRKCAAHGESPVEVGQVFRGRLLRSLHLGDPVHLDGPDGGTTSELVAVTVDGVGNVHLRTQSSLYALLAEQVDHRRVSLLYLRRGYVDDDEVLPDGFYDGGREMEYLLQDDGRLQVWPPVDDREILVVNAAGDPGLRRHLTVAREVIPSAGDLRTRTLLLAQLVSNVLGGVSRGVPEVGSDLEHLCTREIDALRRQHGNVIPLGALSHGVCRHRATLFKYLADRLHIPSRLVRGDAFGRHVWNVVRIGGVHHVTDVMHDPFHLYREGDPRLAHYCRRDAQGGRGGIGGHSIRK